MNPPVNFFPNSKDLSEQQLVDSKLNKSKIENIMGSIIKYANNLRQLGNDILSIFYQTIALTNRVKNVEDYQKCIDDAHYR